MKICKMQLPKDLEPTLIKFHENAQNPIRYVLMNFEEREVEYKDDKWEFIAIYSSLKDAIFSYLSLWNCQPHNVNEYKNDKWTYHPNKYGYKGLYVFEAKENIIYGNNRDSNIYQIKNKSVYRYSWSRRENDIINELDGCQKIEEFDNYVPLQNFDETKLE